MPTSPAARLPFALFALLVTVVILGCSQAPPAASTVASRPAAQAEHGHDHAAGDAHHEHDDEDDDEDDDEEGDEHGEHAHADHGHDEDAHDDHGHDEHGHPETLAEGVTALEKAAAAVKEHLAADARDAADDAIHGLGHLLEDLPGLIKAAPLAEEARTTATKAVDDLFECFDKLDTALHAEPGKGDAPADVHASLAERINAAIASIRGVAESKEDR